LSFAASGSPQKSYILISVRCTQYAQSSPRLKKKHDFGVPGQIQFPT
jgi:hypothetical protein